MIGIIGIAIKSKVVKTVGLAIVTTVASEAGKELYDWIRNGGRRPTVA